MTTQLIAMLAAAGLVTGGVAATAETRSAAALPATSMMALSQAGKTKAAPRVLRMRQVGRPDCALRENERLPACAVMGGGAGGGGGVSAGVLAAIAGGLGVGAIVLAAKNDSNG